MKLLIDCPNGLKKNKKKAVTEPKMANITSCIIWWNLVKSLVVDRLRLRKSLWGELHSRPLPIWTDVLILQAKLEVTKALRN